MLLRTIILIVLLVLNAGMLHADVQDELKGINSQIKEKQQLLKQTKKVETKVSSELVLIEKSLKEKENSLTQLKGELQVVESGVTITTRQIQEMLVELEKKKTQIARRVSSLYKAGEMGSVRIFFTSASIPEVLENRRYMKAVLEQDRKLFQDYQDRLRELQAMKESLEKEALRKERLSEKIKTKKQEIETEKQRKAEYLTKVRLEKKGYQASLKELQANARRLQAMVERLEARSRKSYTQKDEKKVLVPGKYAQPPLSDKGFGAQRGRLSLPTKGQITSSFGKHKHPEFNSFTFNNGIAIAAPLNTDIRSVYDGEVIFADRFKGYGNMVIIDHGGGYFTLYAHAASIVKKVGATVHRNDVVARVGDSDSAAGAQLYFEIRYQGKPVDPGPWFK